MKYFIKGWIGYKFLVSPIELENILKRFHLVVYNRRVSENYIETEPIEYLDKYKIFYEKLVSNYKFVWKNDHNITDLIIGVSDNLSKCTYGEKFKDENDKKYYKTSNFSEPCVGINIFTLLLDENKKLHSDYSYIQYPENILGLELQFPKEIYFYEEGNNELKHQKLMKSNEMETYNNVYKILEDRIKGISKNLNFLIGEKVFRTNIKTSKTIINELKNIYFIKNNNIIINE